MKKTIIIICLLALNTNLVSAKSHKSRARYNRSSSSHIKRNPPRIKNKINTIQKARTSTRHYRGEPLPKVREDSIWCILLDVCH